MLNNLQGFQFHYTNTGLLQYMKGGASYLVFDFSGSFISTAISTAQCLFGCFLNIFAH